MEPIARVVADIAEEMRGIAERGTVASYIPPLASVPADKFGIAVVTADGTVHAAGDADEAFSIQSISKVFALTLALGAVGDQLWNRVGREPSGSAFNSIVQLETEHGIPRNPFINAGAIVVCDVLLGRLQPREAIGQMLRFVRELAGDDDTIRIDETVARAEQETGFRNMALANYMRAFGNIHGDVELVLGTYFHFCALAMSCRQLAMAGRFLMGDGRVEGHRVVTARRARRINALMMSCGHYDNSGDFAYRIGLPGKSGVGGGILSVAPGIASIAVWSPGLNEAGNSHLGQLALEQLVHRTGWSVFEPRG
ncbi:glutaminase [Novosphingobium resinovorum]|uniref:glutaminase n=1 Tax=Sphingomonadaceae TaxID=41297 RepID=UPI00027CC007|nr:MULTISPECIES: glutaminase [Sphingomonadaceae]EJU11346.1 glutaminase [Sphingomonas sp. LH128]MBF7012027.1 glutaminase [Novosphingobium sp. HR1a]WJM26778.1 glutaminase [Novosphingobium resinovorum]